LNVMALPGTAAMSKVGHGSDALMGRYLPLIHIPSSLAAKPTTINNGTATHRACFSVMLETQRPTARIELERTTV
jgi:hypothetical protein